MAWLICKGFRSGVLVDGSLMARKQKRLQRIRQKLAVWIVEGSE